MDSRPVAEKQMFENRWYFLLVCVGFAVGLGNVTRFPYLVYRNGGGAFLIPYLIALALCAWPTATLELLIGQTYRQGPVQVFRRVLPWAPFRFAGVGLASIVTTSLIAMYYVALLGYSCVYLVHSFYGFFGENGSWAGEGPWKGNPGDFYEEILHLTPMIGDLGGVNWAVLLGVTCCMVFVFFSVFGGIQGSSKVAIVTVGLPYLMILILLIRGLTLEGAWDGVRWYLSPDFSKLLEVRVWIDAAVQIMFSLSPCWGVLITFGSYLSPEEDLMTLSVQLAAINSLTSFVAGFAIFAILGHLAATTGVPIDQVVAGGPQLSFVVYPAALATMPFPWFFAASFFIMLLMLGIDSQFSSVEAIIHAIEESRWQQTLKLRRSVIVTGSVLVIWLGSLIFCTDGGLHLLAAADNYIPMLSFFCVAIAEVICVGWAYGTDRFFDDIARVNGSPIPAQPFLRVLWQGVSLAYPVILVSFALVSEIGSPSIPHLPVWASTLGWMAALTPPCIILGYAIFPPGLPNDQILSSPSI